MTQELPYELAGVRRRFASMLYESLLLLSVLSVAFMLPHLALGMAYEIKLPGQLLFIHLAGIMGIYFVWYWNHGGQTLAMQTWRLRIVDSSGNLPSLGQLILRYALSWPSLVCYGVGLLWALFDRDRQFLHERLSGTRIIFVPPTKASPPPPAET